MDLLGLCLWPGKVVAADILRRFGCPVSVDPSHPSSEFFLVISFGRCKFRLTALSVATILQSVLGGVAEHFHVLHLHDRVFRFSVCSSAVGFHICKLRSFICNLFKLYFHLWSRGGPNLQAEYRCWQAEEDSRWTTVGLKLRQPKLTGANAISVSKDDQWLGAISNPRSSRTSVFTRLQFGAVSPVSALHDNYAGILGKCPIGILGKGPALPGCSRCLA